MDDKIKILLIVMIKNESKIIKRCIDSAKNLIDGICVLDTGSTDNTIETVNEKISELKAEKPDFIGKVFNSPFVNFGYSRTESFHFAKQLVDETGWDPETTYGLLLDADHVLKYTVSISKIKESLSSTDSFYIYQYDNRYKYYNIRFIKMSKDWICRGVTHECWTCDSISTIGMVADGLWIDDISDGGCKTDKLERDERLLLKGLEDEPENNRYIYYLGQTYICLEKYEKGIEFFQRYINSDDPTSEMSWFCAYTIGKLYFIYLNQVEKGIELLKSAFKIRPTRAEPLFALCEHYLLTKDYQNAQKYIEIASQIVYPEKDAVYVDEYIYKVGFKLLYLTLLVETKAVDTRTILDMYEDISRTKVCDNKSVTPSVNLLFSISKPISLSHIAPFLYETMPRYISMTQQDTDTYKILIGNTLATVDANLNQKTTNQYVNFTGRTCPQIFCDTNSALHYTCVSENAPHYGKLETVDDCKVVCSTGCFFNEDKLPVFINGWFDFKSSYIINKLSCRMPAVVRNGFNYLLTYIITELGVVYFIVKCNLKGEPIAYTHPFTFEGTGMCNTFSAYNINDFIIVYGVDKKFKFSVIKMETIEEMLIQVKIE